jgi:hypothetical protein
VTAITLLYQGTTLPQKYFQGKILFFKLFNIKTFLIEPSGKISLLCYNKKKQKSMVVDVFSPLGKDISLSGL